MISNDDYTGTTSRTKTYNSIDRSNTQNANTTSVPECIDTRTYSDGGVCIDWEDEEEKIKQIQEAELKLKPKQGWFNPNKIPINNKPIVTIVKKRIRNNLPKQYKNKLYL